MSLYEIIDIDRQWLLALNGSDSLFLDGLVKTLTTASTWIPLYIALLYLVIKNNDQWQKMLLIVGAALTCVVLAGSLDDIFVKPMVARWRPTHDPIIGMDVDLVNGYRGGSYGFFSAHASNTFSLAVFFVLLIRNKVLSIALVIWSLINCWTRIYLGVHFLGDILVGILWGGIVGVAVWCGMKRIEQRLFESKSTYVSEQYTSTGYETQDAEVVVSVLIYTFIFSIFKACYFLYIN